MNIISWAAAAVSGLNGLGWSGYTVLLQETMSRESVQRVNMNKDSLVCLSRLCIYEKMLWPSDTQKVSNRSEQKMRAFSITPIFEEI